MPEKKAPAKKPAAKAEKTVEAGGKTCRAPKCKQPVRAKGYCRKHYIGWRREKVGTKFRYRICSKEGCRKPAVLAGRCAEHKKGAEATEAAAAATPATPAAT
ncbi:MAG: hypothetical protein WCG85_08095 [Polyangia bacterium]